MRKDVALRIVRRTPLDREACRRALGQASAEKPETCATAGDNFGDTRVAEKPATLLATDRLVIMRSVRGTAPRATS